MKIGIQTWGTTGDVRPFIALSAGLSKAGHDVTLTITSVDNAGFAHYADRFGFKIIKTPFKEYSPEEIARIGNRIIQTLCPTKQLKLIVDNFFTPFIDGIYAASKKLCEDNDIVIGHFFVHPLSVAAKLSQKPYVTVALNNAIRPSRFVTPPGLPRLGRCINPLYWRLISRLTNSAILPEINRFREKEGLNKIKNAVTEAMESETLNLIAVSSSFCERQKDWSENHHVCGFFDVPEDEIIWDMPVSLKRFLDDGEPPVFITYGSMMLLDPNPAKWARLLIDTAKKAGIRAIIQSRWDDITGIPESPDIYRIGKVPHRFIFPHCSMVVHHGGAGTTQSATLAGCPSVVIEHLADQRFWGLELKRLGIAPHLLSKRSVTAEKLAREILRVKNSPDMKKRAEEIAKNMKNENGVKRAVELIEKVM